MTKPTYGVCLYHGVSKEQVDMVLSTLSELPVTVALMGPTFDDVRLDSSGADTGSSQTITPTDTYHNPPDVGVKGLIIPGGRGALDAESPGCVTGFLRAAVGNLDMLVTMGAGSVLAARSRALTDRRAAVDQQDLDLVLDEDLTTNWTWADGEWVRDGDTWTATTQGAQAMLEALAREGVPIPMAKAVSTEAETERH